MDTPPDAQGLIKEQLSALVDGELAPDQVERLAHHWHSDPELQSQWHAYHWVRDVLHFQDLASIAGHDAKFLQALRSRLAHEPVVLAPGAPSREALGWAIRYRTLQPAMALAAVLMVGALIWVLRTPGGAAGPAPVSLQSPVSVEPSVVSGASGAAPDQNAGEVKVVLGDWGPTLRDSQLDHYIHAHQQFGGSSALVSPAGFVRHVGTQAPQR